MQQATHLLAFGLVRLHLTGVDVERDYVTCLRGNLDAHGCVLPAQYSGKDAGADPRTDRRLGEGWLRTREWAGVTDHAVHVHRGRLSVHAGARAVDDAYVVLAVVAPGQHTDDGDDEQDDGPEDHRSAFRFVAHTVVVLTMVPVVRVPGVQPVPERALPSAAAGARWARTWRQEVWPPRQRAAPSAGGWLSLSRRLALRNRDGGHSTEHDRIYR